MHLGKVPDYMTEPHTIKTKIYEEVAEVVILKTVYVS